jgi:hypothetical protein
MPKKKSKRGEIPRMSTLSPADQDILMQRWKLRNDLRDAYIDIIDMLVQWSIDDAHIAKFAAEGHQAQFDFQPADDLARRLEANGFSIAEIEARLKADEISADWMTPEEEASVLERYALMKHYFNTHDPGPFERAWRIHQAIGAAVRRNFIQQYGYPPEHSPVPRVRIQGKDSELPKLKPADHQPELF